MLIVMKLKSMAWVAAATLALQGCTFDVTESSAGSSASGDLCKTIAAARAGNASAASAEIAFRELAGRGSFTKEELDNIAVGRAAPGMSETAGLCAWGNYWYDVNTTATANGAVRQYVFGDATYVERRYLYVENGVVTGVQF